MTREAPRCRNRPPRAGQWRARGGGGFLLGGARCPPGHPNPPPRARYVPGAGGPLHFLFGGSLPGSTLPERAPFLITRPQATSFAHST